MKNTVKFGRNLIKYTSVQHIWNLFQLLYRGYLLAVNLQIYLGTSSLKHASNVLKLPGVDYDVAKNWALAMMLKALPLVHFWSVLLLKEQMMTTVRKTLKMFVWSAQNQSISCEICLENNHKIGRFLLIAFWWSLPRKLPWNLTFSTMTYQKPWFELPRYQLKHRCEFLWYSFFFSFVKVCVLLGSHLLGVSDHYTFLENCPPTPPLSQPFSLSEK